jgi:hypothetical protein
MKIIGFDACIGKKVAAIDYGHDSLQYGSTAWP